MTSIDAREAVGEGVGGSGFAAPPGMMRAVVLGSLIGIVAAFAFVGGGMYLAGMGTSGALAVGGMAAFWGGLGFGSMFGGVWNMTRNEEH
ncbi:MAG: hypothetical protein JXA83_02480 [Acidimicrobiales bacterium]|nr:hypothetical protein [Acidimicrobiales bacterium]